MRTSSKILACGAFCLITFCDLYLKRFDLTKSLLFDTFSITVWYKLCRCDHSVLELESFSPPMNWYTEPETSNQNASRSASRLRSLSTLSSVRLLCIDCSDS